MKKISELTSLAAGSAVSTDEVEVARSSSSSSFRMALSALATYIRGLSTALTAAAATFTSLIVSSGTSALQAVTVTTIAATDTVTIENNKFYAAKRGSDNAAIGVLGFPTGSNDLQIKTAGATKEINTSLDVLRTDGGSTASVANNGTTTLTLPAYCTIEIAETSIGGQTAEFVVSNSVIALRHQTSTDFSTTATTASKTNVTYAAGVLTIENKKGSSTVYRYSVRGRP